MFKNGFDIFSTPIIGAGIKDPQKFLNEDLDPLVALDGSSIVESGSPLVVSQWTNIASGPSAGGSAYDLTVVGGAPVIDTVEGNSVVRFDGVADNLRPAVAQSIAQGFTVVLVAKCDELTTVRRLIDGRSTANYRIISNPNGGGIYQFGGTSILAVTGQDSNTNIYQMVGNSTSSIAKVINSTEGVEIGDLGSVNFDYCTLGSHWANTAYWDGWIGGLWVYNRALTDGELSQVENAIKQIWTIA